MSGHLWILSYLTLKSHKPAQAQVWEFSELIYSLCQLQNNNNNKKTKALNLEPSPKQLKVGQIKTSKLTKVQHYYTTDITTNVHIQVIYAAINCVCVFVYIYVSACLWPHSLLMFSPVSIVFTLVKLLGGSADQYAQCRNHFRKNQKPSIVK